MNAGGASIWKSAAFRRYYMLSALCYFGSGLTFVALPVYVYALTESAAVTSLAAASTGAPCLLFGLFACAIADRSRRKVVMTACCAVSGAALLTIPAAATVFGETTAAHLIAANFIVSTSFVWFDAANRSRSRCSPLDDRPVTRDRSSIIRQKPAFCAGFFDMKGVRP